jgi:predicted GIY-YIG superfamily endonuclease
MKTDPTLTIWYVYVLQSLAPRYGRWGQRLPGFFYVGASTDPPRRLRQHNGEIKGGGRYTSKWRPWELRAVYGEYAGQSEALRAERALKRGKRGAARLAWTPADSPLCRGEGVNHPFVVRPSSEPEPE